MLSFDNMDKSLIKINQGHTTHKGFVSEIMQFFLWINILIPM